MHRMLAITFVAVALAACSSMSGTQSTGSNGNPKETKNSTDANKSGNPAAVSPGGAGGGAAGAGGGAAGAGGGAGGAGGTAR